MTSFKTSIATPLLAGIAAVLVSGLFVAGAVAPWANAAGSAITPLA